MKTRPGLHLILLTGYLVQVLLVVLGIMAAWLFHKSRSDLEMLALFLGIVGAAIIIGMIISSIFIHQIKSSIDQVSQVANGNYSLRLPAKGPREIAELANNLNRLAEVLEGQQRNRNLILANVTHELARPIGALKLGVDSLQSGALNDPSLTEDLLREMSRTLVRMEALVNDLSLAAQSSTKAISVQMNCLPLEPFLYGIKSRFWLRAEACKIDLRLDIAPQLPQVFADEMRLNQMIANLVDNALKYSPSESDVVIRAEVEENLVKISVLDHGPGISAEDYPHIYEAFFQGKTAKGVKQGMGLGLSITHQLIQAHQGRMEIKNNPEGGLCASLYLRTCPLTEE